MAREPWLEPIRYQALNGTEPFELSGRRSWQITALNITEAGGVSSSSGQRARAATA